jgi:DNA-binding transcriptional regulator YiaG
MRTTDIVLRCLDQALYAAQPEIKGGPSMSNVVRILKAEIARISKREAKSATHGIGKSTAWLRKTVADLKKRLVLLEKENKSLIATMKKYQVAQPEKVDTEKGKKARFTSRGIRALRKKLSLSQADFGKLLGTTPHAVYLWEKKTGALNLRDKTKAAILSVRGLGAREAKEKLVELGKKLKKAKATASKKRKRS